jgi:hypothetical protein
MLLQSPASRRSRSFARAALYFLVLRCPAVSAALALLTVIPLEAHCIDLRRVGPSGSVRRCHIAARAARGTFPELSNRERT